MISRIEDISEEKDDMLAINIITTEIAGKTYRCPSIKPVKEKEPPLPKL